MFYLNHWLIGLTVSSPKRYTQRQLTKIFIEQADLPIGVTTDMQRRWWKNPTDPDSLRLSLAGLQFVKSNLKLQSYDFALPAELTNQNLLQLERQFKGMYYLLKREKLIVFEEEEAMMLTLHGNDLVSYLDNIESQG
ncbi:hypothetical protein UFOVP112_62 [uncultured Caudovirales phage]|uniref:Uncharacterized protein n=1 Tax=uncultured Caudovirales phage TaxID=2100421 RepID=A0A6J5L657_9CAUD|nr:hypothetical protein UFOVP112_62 [uncultured Caudovirales phage]